MGDRYDITIKCAELNCGQMNEHWHAESSGSMSFTCTKCGKINWVRMGFYATIVTQEEEAELYKQEGFE